MKSLQTIIALLLVAVMLMSWQQQNKTATTSDNWKDKVNAELLAQAQNTQQAVDVFVMLHDQAAVIDAAKKIRIKEAKAEYVYKQLQAKAANTQQQVLRLLTEAQAPTQSFWIVNGVLTKADATLIEQIAQLEEVKSLMPDPWVEMERPFRETAGSAKKMDEIEWGLDMIDAELAWEMGARGQGVVVGGQDTGYNFEHEAIEDKYKGKNGSNFDHNYNWHDAIHELNELHDDGEGNLGTNPCGLNSTVPCDDGSHGTHTMGTMVGVVNDTLKIGVAPDAKWIGCRNMDRGWGKPSTYIECIEWFLAPTDINNQNPDPTKAPHVINNSWGCPEEEGCFPSNFEVMELAINNLRAAGTVVVVSAGNSGSDCFTVSSPPAIFENSFAVGATSALDNIVRFSSRGPVTVDGSFRMKPDVAAPGASILSAINDPEIRFARYSGTSMAGPHVAGLVALMISARPDLAGEVDIIEELIIKAATAKYSVDSCYTDLTNTLPNNTYGHGRVDARGAVAQAVIYAGLDDPETLTGVSAYPNPCDNYLFIDIRTFPEAQNLQIFDIKGQLVFEQDINNGQAILSLSLNTLSQGVYFYHVKGEGQVARGKVVKM